MPGSNWTWSRRDSFSSNYNKLNSPVCKMPRAPWLSPQYIIEKLSRISSSCSFLPKFSFQYKPWEWFRLAPQAGEICLLCLHSGVTLQHAGRVDRHLNCALRRCSPVFRWKNNCECFPFMLEKDSNRWQCEEGNNKSVLWPSCSSFLLGDSLRGAQNE